MKTDIEIVEDYIDYYKERDFVEYKGKRYFVSLAEERVEFVGLVEKEDKE